MVKILETLFPGLAGSGYRITSPKDRRYNCVAWAAGEDHRWWSPDLAGRYYWPVRATRTETLKAVSEAFGTLGYVECDTDAPEDGFEKIALFADTNGTPTHVARQLATGSWTSKLGELEDIEHDLRALEGSEYGQVAKVMKRPVAPG
jgi:hypothetical protein